MGGRVTANRRSPKNVIKLKKHDFSGAGLNFQGFHAPELYNVQNEAQQTDDESRKTERKSVQKRLK